MRKIFLITVLLTTVMALSSLGHAAGEPVKLGLGQVTSIASSTDLGTDARGNVVPPMAQVDSVTAAAAFDSDGKIVHVVLDAAQTKVNFNKDFTVSSDLNALGKTKKELGDAYGMGMVSGIGKEWFEQAAELENWMVGKTVAEVKAMKVKARDAAHPAVPDVPELTSLVTMTVQDYIAAVEKAWENAESVVAGGVKLGLGHEVSIASSRPAAAQVDTTMVAALFDADGKVVGASIDTIQSKVPFDQRTAKVTADRSAAIKSKMELKDDYGMGRVSSIGKEWYEQAAELGRWMVGKTVKEIQELKVKRIDDAHVAVPDVPELTSSVTMTVESYLAAISEAYGNAN
ncbi:MAG: hypothetical protein GX316_05090 [Firmicutes bacterium]|nr:hypothetical protein [Bacillota bacterium]